MRDHDINMLEPEKNTFSGLKRAMIIEITQDFIQQAKGLREDAVRQQHRVADLSWDLQTAQENNGHLRGEVTQLGKEVTRLRKDIQVAQDTVMGLDKQNSNLADVLEDALQASPRLLEFTARMVKALLRGDVKVPDAKAGGTYAVTLLDCRVSPDKQTGGRIGIIKVVRERLNPSLRETVDLINPSYVDPPQAVVLAKGLTREAAKQWEVSLKTSAPYAKFAVTLE